MYDGRRVRNPKRTATMRVRTFVYLLLPCRCEGWKVGCLEWVTVRLILEAIWLRGGWRVEFLTSSWTKPPTPKTFQPAPDWTTCLAKVVGPDSKWFKLHLLMDFRRCSPIPNDVHGLHLMFMTCSFRVVYVHGCDVHRCS